MMKVLFILLLVVPLFSCDIGEITEERVQEIIQEELTEEETEEEPAEPKWSPEPLEVYIFEEEAEQSPETYVKKYTASDISRYYYIVQAVKGKVEMHNRDYPDNPWVWIGGGTE